MDPIDAVQIQRRRHDEAAAAREARQRERTAAMAEARARDRLEVWPTPCPTCFAEPGEACITRNGKRTPRHPKRGP